MTRSASGCADVVDEAVAGARCGHRARPSPRRPWRARRDSAGCDASRDWKNTSGFCALPRMTGPRGRGRRRGGRGRPPRRPPRAGRRRRAARIVDSSCEVRKPSKKCRNGTRARSVAACATSAKSWASCTSEAHSIAQPVERTAMTSEWSPKIDRACVAMARAATCRTVGVSSPAILNIVGIISSRPWLAVKVVARAPFWTAPCSAAAAPPSDCISMTSGTEPQRLVRPAALHASASSPIGEAGVIG